MELEATDSLDCAPQTMECTGSTCSFILVPRVNKQCLQQNWRVCQVDIIFNYIFHFGFQDHVFITNWKIHLLAPAPLAPRQKGVF